MTDFFTPVINIQFEPTSIEGLVSNQSYQRNLSDAHAREMASAFDTSQINPIKISPRDDLIELLPEAKP